MFGTRVADVRPARLGLPLLAVATGVVVLGIVTRLMGFFSLELWADEAGWCSRLLDGNYGWIRPIGYMWLTKQLLENIEVSEPMLRSLSYAAGLVQVPLVFFALRRIVERPVFAVVGTYLLAIHPIAVAMTKEFKPYALESTLHTTLVLLALLYVARDANAVKARARWLVLLVVTAIVAPLFAWTIIFAYPGVFSVVGLQALLDRRRTHVAGAVFGVVATLGMLGALFAARLASKKPDAGYWGQKYDVFYVDDGGVFGKIAWAIEKTADIAGFPSHLVPSWPGWAQTTLTVVTVVLCALGVVALFARRQWNLVALLVLPWLLTFAFNAAKVWPYGMFRTNTFLLFYSLVLVVVGLDAIASLVAARSRAVVTTFGVLGIAFTIAVFPFELDTFRHKAGGTLTAEASVRKALERIYEVETGRLVDAPIDDETRRLRAARAEAVRATGGLAREKRDGEPLEPLDDATGRPGGMPLLVMDGHACTIMRHYRDEHTEARRLFGDWLPSHFVTRCTSYSFNSWMANLHELEGRSFWLVSGKAKFPGLTKKFLSEVCVPVESFVLPQYTLVYRCHAAPQFGQSTVEGTSDL